MIITVDGPTASGKGTLARALAQHFGIYYLDTGSLYRALSVAMERVIHKEKIAGGCVPEESLIQELVDAIQYRYENGTAHVWYKEEDVTHLLRTKEVDWYASHISKYDAVRTHLRRLQRSIGQQHSLVADGRDCGTVIFPHADHAIFLTASLEVRAARVISDPNRKNMAYNLQDALRDVMVRDLRDIIRSNGPLKPAENAIIIDNSALSKEEMIEIVRKRIG